MPAPSYHAPVFGHLGRRLLEGLVGLFAVLGFLYVPLGKHTGFEHARAVLTTPAALAAFADLGAAARGLQLRVLGLWSAEPLTPEPAPASSGPRPVPPRLR